MPRLPRKIVAGHVYHLVSQFVDRNWYVESNLERRTYVSMLGRALSQSDWQCLAYAVMSNHIHLALVAGAMPLDRWLRRVHAPFAGWLNRTHERIGSVFVRGPKDFELDSAGVGPVIAYIHNNPVRARVVERARESSWTSHRAYLGLVPAPPWLHVDAGLTRAGFATATDFDAWVETEPEARDPVPCELPQARTESRLRTDPPRHHAIEIVDATSDELGIARDRLCSRRRCREETLGRQVIVACATELGITSSELSRTLGLSQQGISRLHRAPKSTDVVAHARRVLKRVSGGSSD